jgi:DNA-binding GntR family transcriptional regulator
MRDVRRATSQGRDAREGGIAWHTKILDAVRARSRADARAAMEGHMDETARLLDLAIADGGLRLSAPVLDAREPVR